MYTIFFNFFVCLFLFPHQIPLSKSKEWGLNLHRLISVWWPAVCTPGEKKNNFFFMRSKVVDEVSINGAFFFFFFFEDVLILVSHRNFKPGSFSPGFSELSPWDPSVQGVQSTVGLARCQRPAGSQRVSALSCVESARGISLLQQVISLRHQVEIPTFRFKLLPFF